MEKYIKIWNKIDEFLDKILVYIDESISNSLDKLESNKIERIKQKEYLYDLRYEDRVYEFEKMNRIINDKTKIEGKILYYKQSLYSPFFYNIITRERDFYITKHVSIPEKNIYSFTAPISELRYGGVDSNVSYQTTGGNIHNYIKEQYRIVNEDKTVTGSGSGQRKGNSTDFIQTGRAGLQTHNKQFIQTAYFVTLTDIFYESWRKALLEMMFFEAGWLVTFE